MSLCRAFAWHFRTGRPSSVLVSTRTISIMTSQMMKAIQIKQTGGVEVLQYVDVPRPSAPASGVVVKNHAIGINFIDTYHRSGLYSIELPAVIGREGAGVVDAVGEGETELRVGDRVAYLGERSYAEYTSVPSKYVVKLPDNVDFKTGASLLLQGLTAWTLVKESHALQPGEWALIHAAAGGVGIMLTQLCKLIGANVIGTVSTPAKAELAKKAGADYVINYSVEDVVEKVHHITDGHGVHVVYDGVGKETFETSLAAVRRLGSLISFGNASGPVAPFSLLRLSEKNVRLMRPALFVYLQTREEVQRYTSELFKVVAEKKIKVQIGGTYKLSDAAQAHTDLEGRKTTGKVLLEP